MTTGTIGQRAGNQVVPYTPAKKTKTVDIAITGDFSWSTSRSKGYFYQDTAGTWFVFAKIKGTTTTASAIALVMTSVRFAEKQEVSAYQSVSTSTHGFAYDIVQGGINIYSASSGTEWEITVHCELLEEPTTYTTAANLESLDSAIYIKEASNTNPGLLSHYEEGTWTPSFGDGTGGTVNAASYVRIGNLVHATFNIICPNTGTSAAAQTFSLPIAMSSDTNYTVSGNISLQTANLTGLGAIYGLATEDTSVVRMLKYNSGAVNSNVSGNDLSGSTLHFSVTYRVD